MMRGTLQQLGEQMLESFQRLSPQEQAEVRKAVFEEVTGLPYEEEPNGY